MQVDFAVLSTNGSQYDALNGTFFVRDSSAISYGNTLVPPLRKAVTDWLTDRQHVRPSARMSCPSDLSIYLFKPAKTRIYTVAYKCGSDQLSIQEDRTAQSTGLTTCKMPYASSYACK